MWIMWSAKGPDEGRFGGQVRAGRGHQRAMIVTILYRLEGELEVSGPSPFFDVPADGGQWYTNAILWAGRNGIVEGYIEGPHKVFGPDKPITREQLAAILYRYVQTKGGGFTGAWYFPFDFADAADVSDWADEAMHWCVMNGIFEGMRTASSARRAKPPAREVAAILMRFLENVK